MNLLKTRFFRHYKNKPYRYFGIVKHSESLEDLVLYETLYENKTAKLWVRPKDMFFEDVIINSEKLSRFKPIEFTLKEYFNLSDVPLEELKKVLTTDSLNNTEKFNARVKDKDQLYCVAAYDGADLVGFKLGYAENSETFYSWLGGVKTEFRGLGVASELMRRQHEWCVKQGFKVVETHSRHPFVDMMKLNLSFGFKIVGTLIDQKKQTKVIFQKELSS